MMPAAQASQARRVLAERFRWSTHGQAESARIASAAQLPHGAVRAALCIRRVAPRAVADGSPVAAGRAARIGVGADRVIVRRVPVVAVLEDVAGHVVEAIAVCREVFRRVGVGVGARREGWMRAARGTGVVAEGSGGVVVDPGVLDGIGVGPGEPVSGGAAPSCLLPFRLRGQPVPGAPVAGPGGNIVRQWAAFHRAPPVRVRSGPIPGNVHDRMILLSADHTERAAVPGDPALRCRGARAAVRIARAAASLVHDAARYGDQVSLGVGPV